MFDTKCLELAEHFLPDQASPRLKTALAQHIQDEVEDWLETEANEIAATLPKSMRP